MDNFNAVVFIFTKYETNVKREMMPFWRAIMHVQVNKKHYQHIVDCGKTRTII